VTKKDKRTNNVDL